MNSLFDETSITNKSGQIKDYIQEPIAEDIEKKQSDLHYRTPKKIFSRTAEEAGVGLKTRRLYMKQTFRSHSYCMIYYMTYSFILIEHIL